jgi:RNA polymerase sigma-70 factor, ECF subfamily
VRNPEAWLSTVVSRLAIDHLRSAQHRREVYPDEWLPEPVLLPPQEQDAITRSRLSIALLHLLEHLDPEPRAAFVLREVLEYSYREIAKMLTKSEVACRQMVTRARNALANQTATESSSTVSSALVSRFVDALTSGDEQTLMKLVAPDAMLISDGGGKARAAVNLFTVLIA